MRAPVAVVLGIALAACGAGDASSGVPDAVRSIARHEDVERFEGWSVPGLTLFRLSFAAADLSRSTIVGYDPASREVVRGAALMRRVGPAAPDVLARRVFDVLLGQRGAHPLTLEDRHALGTDAEWARVRPAVMEGDVLVFFAWRGEMSPQLVEHRVDTGTWEVATRSVVEVIVADGGRAAVGGVRCAPRSVCGCWDGCAAFQSVRVPERDPDRVWLVLVGEPDGPLYTPRRECASVGGVERCARVCRADSPTADCDDPILPEEPEECGEACPPSESFYHCVLYEHGGCGRVEHPRRRAAAGR
ncbi:MAG: hypothetical protein KF729_37930 [Sandaracinaceae bacterium]|nr:hypothetical protein [Sandaracinaceae bacterium]